MEEDKNLEQNLDKSNEKSHISDVYNDSLKLEEINYQNGGKSFDILWEKVIKKRLKNYYFFMVMYLLFLI